MVHRSTLWRHANPTPWRLYDECPRCGVPAGRACTPLKRALPGRSMQRPHPGRSLKVKGA